MLDVARARGNKPQRLGSVEKTSPEFEKRLLGIGERRLDEPYDSLAVDDCGLKVADGALNGERPAGLVRAQLGLERCSPEVELQMLLGIRVWPWDDVALPRFGTSG